MYAACRVSIIRTLQAELITAYDISFLIDKHAYLRYNQVAAQTGAFEEKVVSPV